MFHQRIIEALENKGKDSQDKLLRYNRNVDTPHLSAHNSIEKY